MSVIIFLTLALMSYFFDRITGSGPVVSRVYHLRDFKTIYTPLEADIYYTCGETYQLEIFAQQNIIEVLEASVANGALKIEFDKFKNVKNYDRIAIFITAPFLADIATHNAVRTGRQQYTVS